ncbi:MAG: DUF2589 domain-containing protein [Lachnospiraceae bacterium]
MPRNEVGEIVNSLPIEHMVAAPIIAAVKAQREVSGMLAEFLNTVALDSNGNARMLTFKYEQETQGNDGNSTHETRYIQAPFVALSGIPNLAVETVQVNFDLEVTTSDTDKKTTSGSSSVNGKTGFFFTPQVNFSASLSHSSEQTRQTDTRAKYSFHVEARKQEQPEALMRILETITNAATVPTKDKPALDNLTESGNSNGEGTEKNK